jgi:hypothetical protein
MQDKVQYPAYLNMYNKPIVLNATIQSNMATRVTALYNMNRNINYTYAVG